MNHDRTRHARAPRLTRRAEVLVALGDRIRERRLARGLRQEDLARSVGLSVAYISLIERGGRNPPFTTVVSLARALRTRPADLA